MVRVGDRYLQRVSKNSHRLGETDAVLFHVGFRLGKVPFELHDRLYARALSTDSSISQQCLSISEDFCRTPPQPASASFLSERRAPEGHLARIDPPWSASVDRRSAKGTGNARFAEVAPPP